MKKFFKCPDCGSPIEYELLDSSSNNDFVGLTKTCVCGEEITIFGIPVNPPKLVISEEDRRDILYGGEN